MVCVQSLSPMKKTKRFLLLLGLAIMTSCGQADPPIPMPPSTSLPQLSTTTTMEPETTTTTTELPAVPVPVTEPEMVEERPILCPGYSHPLHHLSCDEAASKKELPKTISTPKSTVAPSRTTSITSGSLSVAGLSDLPACIAKYESTSGQLDSNIYQFVPSTWKTYGGEGSPENASVSRQTEVFWTAWADGGPHHWAAQKGRCF